MALAQGVSPGLADEAVSLSFAGSYGVLASLSAIPGLTAWAMGIPPCRAHLLPLRVSRLFFHSP